MAASADGKKGEQEAKNLKTIKLILNQKFNTEMIHDAEKER